MQPTAQAVGGLEMIQAPERRKKLTPDIFLVHDNPILLEECAEFVLKGMLLVMFFLSRNVFRYGGDTGFAHAEDSVSCLPTEVRIASANPAR